MRLILTIIIVNLTIAMSTSAVTLKEMYDSASKDQGYDKYIVLDTGVTYSGGLYLGGTFNRITSEFETKEEDVRIVGNGAVLDLSGAEICISYTTGRLDIDDCVVINGNFRFRGYDGGGADLIPDGSVRYVTFYKPHDYGVRLYGCGDGIVVERNIVVDAVDTGSDFQYITGYQMDWLPTGAAFSLSLTGGSIELHDNWSFHSDTATNADPIRHFQILCDYG